MTVRRAAGKAAATLMPRRCAGRAAPARADSSMGARTPSTTVCQKVQPLQASSPCTSAPTRWMEPVCVPARTVPSARTSAAWRERASVRMVPGVISPASTSEPKGTRGSPRLPVLIVERRIRRRLDRGDARLGRGDVALLALDADEVAAEPLGDGAGGAGAEEGIEHDVAGLGVGEQDAVEQRLRLLGRVGLVALLVLQPLVAGADREQPVGAHLGAVIGFLQRVIIERVALGVGVAARPDQRLVGIGEAPAAEVRHRVGLAPDDVVEDPEAEVLEDGADAEDVVVGADHPEGAVRLQHPAAGIEPGAGEIVIGGEAGELVPVVVDGVDLGLVGPGQAAFELQVVGRIGEDQVDRGGRELLQLGNAVALQNRVEPGGFPDNRLQRTHDHPDATQPGRASLARRNLGQILLGSTVNRGLGSMVKRR